MTHSNTPTDGICYKHLIMGCSLCTTPTQDFSAAPRKSTPTSIDEQLDEILGTLLDGSSTYDWEMVDVPERAEVAKSQLKALLIEQRINELETMGRINALINRVEEQ